MGCFVSFGIINSSSSCMYLLLLNVVSVRFVLRLYTLNCVHTWYIQKGVEKKEDLYAHVLIGAEKKKDLYACIYVPAVLCRYTGIKIK